MPHRSHAERPRPPVARRRPQPTRIGARRAARAAFGAAALALLLCGCAVTAPDLAPTSEAHAAFVRRPGVSLSGASVAFVSVDGPPAAIASSFSKIMAREALSRDIVIADEKKATYLVRGYLSSYATSDGAAVEYVWDVFDRHKQRMQRVSDVLEVKGAGADANPDAAPDPWSLIGEDALKSVAGRSADDLAAYLSNTPAAVAEAPAEAPESKPLSYAPVN